MNINNWTPAPSEILRIEQLAELARHLVSFRTLEQGMEPPKIRWALPTAGLMRGGACLGPYAAGIGSSIQWSRKIEEVLKLHMFTEQTGLGVMIIIKLHLDLDEFLLLSGLGWLLPHRWTGSYFLPPNYKSNLFNVTLKKNILKSDDQKCILFLKNKTKSLIRRHHNHPP